MTKGELEEELLNNLKPLEVSYYNSHSFENDLKEEGEYIATDKVVEFILNNYFQNKEKKEMTKGEFTTKVQIAEQLANTAFSKIGLTAKRFTKTFSEEYADLIDEQYFLRKDFAELDEKKQAKKDQQGNLILDTTKEKEMVAALKLWKKELIEIDFSKLTPVKLTGKELFMSAVIFDELNGFVFDIDENEYLTTLEAEIIRQNEEAK